MLNAQVGLFVMPVLAAVFLLTDEPMLALLPVGVWLLCAAVVKHYRGSVFGPARKPPEHD